MKFEVELFEPVKDYFIAQGYDLRAEVNDCDVVGIKGEEIVIIELKLKFNADLLVQVADRLRYTDLVYVAVPSKEVNLFKKKGKKQKHLLRTLGVGLLLVSTGEEGYTLREAFPPKQLDQDLLRKRNKKKRMSLIKEFEGRESLKNMGGQTRVAIHTAYKELAMKIRKSLEAGPKSIKEIKSEIGDNPKISSVLQKNYYGWFERVDRGVYRLKDQ